jgi:polar amino acid transport system substrate-binding protein
MRSVKQALLVIGLLLTVIGCGEKEIRTAAKSMSKFKAVRIVTDAVNAPFEFGSGTGVQGLDIDLGSEIGKALGFEVKWIKASGYDHLFEILKNGEAEIIISAIAMDPQRFDGFAFSKPYYDSGDVIAHQRSEASTIKDLSGLSGKKVGVAAGRPGDRFMATQKTPAGVTIIRYTTLDDALGALNRTEIDAVVGDEPMITYSSYKSYKNTTVRQDLVINRYKYAAVVRKEETELLGKINATIDRMMTSGEIDKSADKFFGNVRDEARNQLAEDTRIARAKRAPKTIDVNVTKLSGAWDMDRLDGFDLALNGPVGQYRSTSIRTEGNKGHCKFTNPVPPGEYKLNMSVLRTPKTVSVPELPKASLTMDINLGSMPTIQFR